MIAYAMAFYMLEQKLGEGMEAQLEFIDLVIQLVYYIFSSLMLFWSLSKCFWDGKKNRIVLFLLTILANSMVGLVFALLCGLGLADAVIGLFHFHITKKWVIFFMINIFPYMLAGPFYLAHTLLMAWICGKWLHVENYNSVLFLFVTFGAINLVAVFRDSGDGELLSNMSARNGISIACTIMAIIALLLFYVLDVKAFAKLAYVKVKVNWKVFLIPPIAFILLYGVIAGLLLAYEEFLAILTLFFFSTMLIFLLIWAFYVIIRNIHETNEAVKAKEEVKTLSVEVMEALAHTIDAKDEYTRGHSVRVAKYSRMLAEKLGLSKEDCDNVYYMGLLHDIGKIGVPNEIINSKSKLTDEEYAVIKTHPGVGYGILDEIKSRPDLSIGAHWHHERYDGKGYPDGKAGEDIPYFARIIAVADSYDAMTSNRSYRKYLSQDVVRSELRKNEGTQFDPKIAECMIELIEEDKDYKMHE